MSKLFREIIRDELARFANLQLEQHVEQAVRRAIQDSDLSSVSDRFTQQRASVSTARPISFHPFVEGAEASNPPSVTRVQISLPDNEQPTRSNSKQPTWTRRHRKTHIPKDDIFWPTANDFGTGKSKSRKKRTTDSEGGWMQSVSSTISKTLAGGQESDVPSPRKDRDRYVAISAGAAARDTPRTERDTPRSESRRSSAADAINDMTPVPSLHLDSDAPCQSTAGASDGFSEQEAPSTREGTLNKSREDSLEPLMTAMTDQVKPLRSHISEYHGDSQSSEKKSMFSSWGRPVASRTRLSVDGLDSISLEAGEEPDFIADMVQTDSFAYLTTVFILLNSALIGIQTDYVARRSMERVPLAFSLVESIFCLIFIAELALRIYASGWSFCCGTGRMSNLFDISIVGLQVIEQFNALIPMEDSSGVSKELSIFRVFRVLRIVRLVRVFHLVAELRTLLVSLFGAMRSLFWTMVLLLSMMYIFGVLLTQMVTDARVHDPEGRHHNLKDLDMYFGTLDKTMLYLYESISEGVHWGVVMEQISSFSPLLGLFFAIYMGLIIFAMLNVVTGVFVQSAIDTANEDKKNVLMYQMHQFFASADKDGNGTITLNEFQEQLHHPQMQQFLKAIDLDQEEANELFMLLDMEGKGEIEAEELVNGALRLHGFAKAIDLAAFSNEFKQMHNQILEQSNLTKESINNFLQCMQGTSDPGARSSTMQSAVSFSPHRVSIPESQEGILRRHAGDSDIFC